MRISDWSSDVCSSDLLIGGKLHFIVKHTLVARAEILRFEDRSDGRIDTVCLASLERIHPQPKRAHAGWRYLAGSEAPTGTSEDGGQAQLPPELYRERVAHSMPKKAAGDLSRRASVHSPGAA